MSRELMPVAEARRPILAELPAMPSEQVSLPEVCRQMTFSAMHRAGAD